MGESVCFGTRERASIAAMSMETPAPASASAFLDSISAWTGAVAERPSWDEYFMGTALLMATRSSCGRLRVGCVLVSGGDQRHRIIAAGYNGFLPGAPHLSRVVDGHEQATVHAEQNAIADAARRGASVEGATAYITHFPCINCAKILASSGIRQIRYREDYRNDPLVRELLEEAGVAVHRL
jgi:dCMP deaminase